MENACVSPGLRATSYPGTKEELCGAWMELISKEAQKLGCVGFERFWVQETN